MDWLDQINKNSGALSAIFSGVVTVATVIYAWLTAKLVNETRRMREAQTEPHIQVTYRTRDEWINLLDVAVRNIGLGPAYDITFQLRAEHIGDGTNDLVDSLGKLGCFSNGLAYLGPNQEFSSFWTSLMDGHASKLDTRVLVNCRYRSATGTRYEIQCVLDLSELKGISRIGEPPLLKIGKQLESMAKDLNHLTTGFKRLKVDGFTQADREAELAAWEMERAEFVEKHKPVDGA
ncbi:MAG: hypothetical protein ACREXG_01240 [Polaromonas sp.]